MWLSSNFCLGRYKYLTQPRQPSGIDMFARIGLEPLDQCTTPNSICLAQIGPTQFSGEVYQVGGRAPVTSGLCPILFVTIYHQQSDVD